jgi:hypothetical protein
VISIPPRFWLSAWLLALLAFLCPGVGHAADAKNKSKAGQFTVYSEDKEMRVKVAAYARQLQEDVQHFLRDTSGDGNVPIVITMVPPGEAQPATPVEVRWTNTVGGSKIDVIVRLGGDPTNVFLQRNLVRAMLLELSFRGRPGPKANEPYLMPAWWLVEGIIENLRRRESGEDRDLFKSIVETQKVPPLEKWLTQPPVNLEGAAGAVDRACAMCLVDALLALPGGSDGLDRFIAAWPNSGGRALPALMAEFPTLAGSEHSLAKWWVLQLARFASNDKLEGMTLPETDQALAALLTFELPVDKAGRLEKLTLQDFPRFIKFPASRTFLHGLQVKLVTLETKANPILRPVISEYAQIVIQLSSGKTRKIADRISEIEQYRSTIVERSAQITDYLNWYEATQPVARSGSFAGYLKQVEKFEEHPIPTDPRIVDYLNGLEQDFAPVEPRGIPNLNIVPDPKTGTAINR